MKEIQDFINQKKSIKERDEEHVEDNGEDNGEDYGYKSADGYDSREYDNAYQEKLYK